MSRGKNTKVSAESVETNVVPLIDLTSLLRMNAHALLQGAEAHHARAVNSVLADPDAHKTYREKRLAEAAEVGAFLNDYSDHLSSTDESSGLEIGRFTVRTSRPYLF